MTKKVVYRIESGWETNPFWDCEVSLQEMEEDLVFTTPRAGAPPEPMIVEAGKQLVFRCRGSLWTLSAREGELFLVNDDSLERITEEEAVEALEQANYESDSRAVPGLR
jgi:hypothetical protein